MEADSVISQPKRAREVPHGPRSPPKQLEDLSATAGVGAPVSFTECPFGMGSFHKESIPCFSPLRY
jgi:hypothetical protein